MNKSIPLKKYMFSISNKSLKCDESYFHEHLLLRSTDWGSHSVGELRCGGAAVWESCRVGICGVGDLRCEGVAVWGSRGLG